MNSIASRLIAWYDLNRRPLPWRETSDPYAIWLSEVILQQTRVAQGTDYYHRFLAHFPTVGALAAAGEDEVLKLWQGLGYYSRARNLHAAARRIVEQFEGRFPADYAALRTLPGVGDYTAAAIASFAFGLPCAAVDGNVYRLLSRLFALDTPIDSGEGKRQFAALAASLLDPARAGSFNQATMEFGALQCVPGQPDCAVCPLTDICLAYKQGTVTSLPVKQGKTTVRDRWFNYLVVRCAENVLLSRRVAKDIWQGLYEFPLLESDRPLDYPGLAADQKFIRLFKGPGEMILRSQRTMPPHQLSHQRIHATFFEFETGAFSAEMLSDYTPVSAHRLDDYAVPRLVERYMELSGK